MDNLNAPNYNASSLAQAEYLYAQNEIAFGLGSFEWDALTDRSTWSAGMFRLFDRDPADYPAGVNQALLMTWIDPRDHAYVVQTLGEVIASRAPLESLFRPLLPSGAERWLRVKNAPTFDAEGHFIKLSGTAFDVTKEQQALQKLHENEALLHESEQLLNYGAWLWKVAEDRVEWTEGLWKLLDYPAAEQNLRLTPSQYLQHIHPDDQANQMARIREVTARGETAIGSTEHRLITHAGRLIWVTSRSRILEWLPDGRPALIAGATADITHLKSVQQELESKVDELRRSNEELERFAYVASHDLQEPLRKIASFGSMLRRRYQEALGEDGCNFLERIENATQRMQNLIDDLLRFSRIGRKEDAVEPVDLNDLWQELLNDLERRLQEKQAVVEVGALPTLGGIPSQMRQLFQNLLYNSLKFSHSDRPPRIVVQSRPLTAEETDQQGPAMGNDYYQITVSDNGIGFEQKDAERIFAIFQRLHGHSEYEGSGIGLAIVKKIVENHQGRITAEGRPGEGATFTVILPTHIRLTPVSDVSKASDT